MTQPAGNRAPHVPHSSHPANVEVSRPPERRRPQIDASHAQIIIALGVLLTIVYFAKAPLIVLIVAVLVAFILEPAVQLLERLRLPRWAAALVVVFLMLALIGLTLLFSYQKVADLIRQLPQYSTEIRNFVLKLRRQAQQIQSTTQDILAPATQQSKAVTVVQQSNPTDAITSSIGTLSEFLMSATFVPFLAYFMLTWKDHVRKSTVELFDPSHRTVAYATLGEISAMIKSFLSGNALIGLFLAVMGSLVFKLIGVPYYFIVGTVSGILSLVPYFGVLLAIVPPLVVGIGQVSRADIAVIVGTVLGLHVFAFQVLYPKLLGKRLALNPLAVTLSLLMWGSLWGAWGLVLALPITAMMKIVFDHVERLRSFGDWLGE
jgi:predicted PurR-regulated permease PerM